MDRLPSDTINICHVNCQSLVPHFDEFNLHFSELSFHAICMSETWLKPWISNSVVELQNYSLIRNDRLNKGGGGVGIYIHHTICYKVIASSDNIGVNRPEFLLLEIRCDNKKLLLGVVYRPPYAGFLSEFEATLLSVLPSYSNLVVMGDFNIDMLSSTFDSRHLTNFLLANNFTLIPHDPTNHVGVSNTLIDLCFVDTMECVAAYGQYSADFLSSHDLIYIRYKGIVKKIPPSSLSRRSLRDINIDAVVDDLNNRDWRDFFTADTIDKKVHILNEALFNVFDVHAPVRSVTYRRPPAPWITPDIRVLMRERDRIRRAFRRHRTRSLFQKYRLVRNNIKCRLDRAKNQYYRHKFSDLKNSPYIWRELKYLRIIPSRSNDQPLLLSVDNLAAYFVAPSREVSTSLLQPNFGDVEFNEHKFYFTDINPLTLMQAFKSLKSDATGVDKISTSMIKIALPAIFPMVLHIFNSSLINGFFPTLWKSALIRPIPKVKSPSTPGDYRPTSILCALSKPLERLVSDQLMSFLQDSDLLDPYQSAYRTGYNTQSALLRLTNDIYAAADSRLITVMVSFDFSKAFDRVRHDMLIAKLQSLNISHSVLHWIHSYLSDRSQAVVSSEGSRSIWLTPLCGVPQGSVLGPLLFTLYLTDFRHNLKKCRYNYYADDLQIYLSFPPSEINEYIDIINGEIASILLWASGNNLLLNANKTKAIIFGTSRYINSLDMDRTNKVMVGTSVIPFSSSLRILGVTLTSNLSWNEHVLQVSKKINMQLYSLKIAKNSLPTWLRARLVKALILPHLDYCSLVTGNMTDDLISILQRALNSAVRFIFDLRRDQHVTPFYVQLNLLKIKARHNYLLATYLHQILTTERPKYLCSMFSFVDINRAFHTRLDERKLVVPSRRLELYAKAFRCSAVAVWNSLPWEIRVITSSNAFKSSLFQYLLDRATTTLF